MTNNNNTRCNKKPAWLEKEIEKTKGFLSKSERETLKNTPFEEVESPAELDYLRNQFLQKFNQSESERQSTLSQTKEAIHALMSLSGKIIDHVGEFLVSSPFSATSAPAGTRGVGSQSGHSVNATGRNSFEKMYPLIEEGWIEKDGVKIIVQTRKRYKAGQHFGLAMDVTDSSGKNPIRPFSFTVYEGEEVVIPQRDITLMSDDQQRLTSAPEAGTYRIHFTWDDNTADVYLKFIN